MTTELLNRPTRRPPPQLSGNITTAEVLATAAADDGPAAGLAFGGSRVIERMLGHLTELGIGRVHVITRPEWEDAFQGLSASVEVCFGLSEDMAKIAEIARAARGGVVVAQGEVITHRGALEGLLASPGVVTGVLSTAGGHGSPFAFRARTARGRVVSAASAYHGVAAPRTSFLGVLKVAAADNDALVEVAERLAELTADRLPEGWEAELRQKGEQWRLTLGRAALKAERRAARDALEAAGRARDELPLLSPEEYSARRRDLARQLPPDMAQEYELRYAAAAEDAAALLLVGLIRRGVHVGNSFVRGLFWARPLSHAAVEKAAIDMQAYDEDKVLLSAAVKASDGFFTTFFVSTWSRYIARWAANRGLRPNQITVFALCLGVLAGAAFATGERPGYIAGGVLAYLSFVFDCVDGQLARYTRTFSKFGAWLDSVFDRSKEYVCFAGLAIGAGTTEVWTLAAAALTLQTFRHSFDFSYGATDRQAIAETPQPALEQAPDEALGRNRMKHRGTLEAKLGALEDRPATAAELAEAREDDESTGAAQPGQRKPLARRVLGLWRLLDRIPGLVWLKKMFSFPIGERFAVIAIVTAVFDPRTTFLVILAWGGFALVYTSSGRILRTVAQWRAIPR